MRSGSREDFSDKSLSTCVKGCPVKQDTGFQHRRNSPLADNAALSEVGLQSSREPPCGSTESKTLSTSHLQGLIPTEEHQAEPAYCGRCTEYPLWSTGEAEADRRQGGRRAITVILCRTGARMAQGRACRGGSAKFCFTQVLASIYRWILTIWNIPNNMKK